MEKDKLLILVGKNIRTLRKSKRISQENFAYEADINRGFYGAIERGEKSASVTTLVKIALALNVQVGELFPNLEELKNLKK